MEIKEIETQLKEQKIILVGCSIMISLMLFGLLMTNMV